MGGISSLPRRKAVVFFQSRCLLPHGRLAHRPQIRYNLLIESVPKDGRQKSLVEVLSHLYRVNKVYVAKKVAATSNVSTLYRDQTEYSTKKATKEKKVEA